MPRLVIMNGAEAGKSFDLSAPETTLGRHSGVDIKLSGTNVSRRHSRIYSEGSSWFIEDLGSSNGTFLNGLKLDLPASLKSGDEIRIGAFLLQFESVAPQVDPELTIRARAAARTNNLELFRDNPAQKLRVILELGNHLARSLDTDHLLNELLNHLFVLFSNAERGLIIFFENENPVVRVCKNRSGTPAAPQYSNSVLQIVLREAVGLLAEDVQSDSRFAAAQSIYNLGVRSVMCVPLKRKNERIFGLIQLDRFGTGHRFQPEDLHLFTAISLQASVALENAQLHLELVQKERIEKELALARQIQLGYLPKSVPRLRNSSFELYGDLHPAYEVSGDFYDYFAIDDHQLAIAVADVSGKGMPAALFMSSVRVLLRQFAAPGRLPGEILATLNNALADDNPGCLFVTIILAFYNSDTGQLQIASGGHPPALLLSGNRVAELNPGTGVLLGFEPIHDPLPTLARELAPGETILLYTDGVTEAPAANGEQFGVERLRQAIQNQSPMPLKDCSRSVRDEVLSFSGDVQDDDITLVFLRRI